MNNTKFGQCPLCHLAQEITESDAGERISVKCARCGRFTITRTVARALSNSTAKPRLMAWLRERSETGAEIAEINTYSLKSLEETLPNYRVSEKQSLLLAALERQTQFPGADITLKPALDYPLGWSSTEVEFRYILSALRQRGLLQTTGGTIEAISSDVLNVRITPDGWSYIEDRTKNRVISDQAFIAMSFADELRPAWEAAIRPAVVEAGFRPYRVDAEPHSDRIDMKIMSEIKLSRFVISDVTLQRPGVYFEAGYAIGLGIPVIWSVNREELSKVHFDTRQYNHIVWGDLGELKEQLHSFIVAIIGRGSVKTA